MPLRKHIRRLEDLYRTFNRKEYIHPDPLEFVYRYDEIADMEVAGLIASCLAYGRVKQILRSVSSVLEPLGANPSKTILGMSPSVMKKKFRGFRHRFQTDHELVALLKGIRSVLRSFGSLERCFTQGFEAGDKNVLRALGFFVRKLDPNNETRHLVPDPSRRSACKRLHLFLRWMVRQDRVDVGIWRTVSADKLLVPLDTHMHRIAIGLGTVRSGRKSADLQTVLEVTEAFKIISPGDPVKYDFALTRLGIREDCDVDEFLGQSQLVEKAYA